MQQAGPAGELTSTQIDARALTRALASYRGPNLARSIVEILITAAPLALAWTLMWAALSLGYFWLYIVLAVPTAGFLVRIFIIQHDCGHHSFFRSHRANDVLGFLCGIFTATPYACWRRAHARHHVTSGNLNHRGHGDVGTLTVEEYLGRSRAGRMKYRLYRHPLVMFFLGAGFLFIIRQRFTYGIPRSWHRERRSVHATNLGILIVMAIGSWLIGLPTFLMIELPVITLGAAAGSWLFFVQHQFEGAYWQPQQEWDFTRSALEGSSYYRLPRVLQWFTGNIGYHHIHHLNSHIPNYNLPACYAAEPAFRQAITLDLRDGLQCVSLKLWDERLHRMVTFAEAHARAA